MRLTSILGTIPPRLFRLILVWDLVKQTPLTLPKVNYVPAFAAFGVCSRTCRVRAGVACESGGACAGPGAAAVAADPSAVEGFGFLALSADW
jgi:hypothetical protein